jgi:hypothetical protein
MHNSKRAQESPSGIATVLFIIAFFMVLYILFVPPEERSRILGSENVTDSVGTSRGRIELLTESPGLVTPDSKSATVHRISSVNIFLRDEPKITKLSQELSVYKSWFTSSSPVLKFTNEDVEQTKKVTLFFSVDNPSGELKVKLNGNTIYGEEIQSSGIKIIEIAKSNLKEENQLELSVSSPIFAFWKTNKYQLKDVGIKQEFERRNNEETRTFTIPKVELEGMAKAKLSYTQQCNYQLGDEVTQFELFLNDKKAHSGKIRCVTTETELELPTDLFVEGSNTISFTLEKGDFTLNQLKLETESKSGERPTYFFSVTDSQYRDIRSGARKLKLQLSMVQNNKIKTSKFLINNNELLMQTDRSSFEKDLKDYVIEGTNFIRITPSNSFEIVGLKVILE